MLTKEGCLRRQERLRNRLEESHVDATIICDPANVYYLTGWMAHPRLPVCAVLTNEGVCSLIAADQPEPSAAHKVYRYNGRLGGGLAQDLVPEVAKRLCEDFDELWNASRHIGIEKASVPFGIAEVLQEEELVGTDIMPDLRQLRRRKDEDELALIRRSIEIAEVAYAVGRSVAKPGRTELEVHHAMHAAVMDAAGTTIPFAGDFATGLRCATGGGPPTSRQIQEGDLYLLDIWPIYGGYWADVCRTFAVSGANSIQIEAWQVIVEALTAAEKVIRPGTPTAEVRRVLQEKVDKFQPLRGSFGHHGGHGFGLDPHEAPRILLDSTDTFEFGDVFTLEPGIYGELLQGGIRLEQDYQVTKDGIERLTKYPLEL